MKREFYCMALILMLVSSVSSNAFDLSQTDKHGNKMSETPCNPDTVIDFRLSSSSTITCTTAGCTVSNPSDSAIRFLDVGGSEDTYILDGTQTQIYKITAGTGTRSFETGLIKLGFTSGSKSLYVGVPFTSAAPTSSQFNCVDLTKIGDTAFNTIQTTVSITNMPMSGFNFLNRRQFGNLYSIADSASSPSVTYLMSYFVFGNIKFDYSNLPTSAYNFPDASIFSGSSVKDIYAATGDKLCWGSTTQVIFQTHLRESYPLWTAMIGLFFYWIYIMVAEANEIECYDKKYEDNKWTCWGILSLNRLGHQDYFTKLSRTSSMLITFSWYMCVIAILYAQVPPGKGSVMILWAAVVALFTGMPFTYAMGYIFLRKIYEFTLQKYLTLKKMKDVFNKKDPIMDAYEKEVDDIEEALYTYYYWYYVLVFVFFSAFSTIAVHQMKTLSREYYYFHFYFLASVGVALGLEHLLIDPIMTYFFGNFTFYRNRGFFYDFKLGAAFKEIQE